MNSRRYYSIRTGQHSGRYDLSGLRKLFLDCYLEFLNKHYFQEYFGYHCIAEGDVAGILGLDIEARIFRAIRRKGLWPIKDNWENYSENDVFDLIEFLYDHISKPIDGQYHSWTSFDTDYDEEFYHDCGWHYSTFDRQAGQQEFRDVINQFLPDYQEGYELSAKGEILIASEQGLGYLFEANLPIYDPENVEKRVESAILKFRRSRSSLDERRDAIRDLADVFEFLRPKLREVLTKQDEGDLFNIVNNFGIRHHNDQQRNDYDPIWCSWMFYYFLATIHACLRFIEKKAH